MKPKEFTKKACIALTIVLCLCFPSSTPTAAEERAAVSMQKSRAGAAAELKEISQLRKQTPHREAKVDGQLPEPAAQKPEKEADAENSLTGKPMEQELEGGKPLESGRLEKTETRYGPDRRWIITQRKTAKDPAAKKKTIAVTWRDEQQRERCEKNLAALRDRFLKARYYSIQGDSCVTADYAGSFLAVEDICRRECPDQFLEASGYSGSIIRNLELLQELGDKRCPIRRDISKKSVPGGGIK